MKSITLHTKGRLKTSKASFAKTRYSDFYKPNQAGMTLIEVLVDYEIGRASCRERV